MAYTPLNVSSQLSHIAEEFVERSFNVADRYLTEVALHEFVLSLSGVSIAVLSPHGIAETALLEGAFIATEHNIKCSWRLVIIDGDLGHRPPDRRWDPRLNQPTGQLRLPGDSVRIAVDPIVHAVWVMDHVRKCVLVFVTSMRALPRWWFATPLRLGLSWIADVYDAEFVHGAAIGRNGQGIVLAGPSGIGKSTLSLKMAFTGWEFLSDDFFLVKETTATSVYRRAKLNSDSLHQLRCPPMAEFVERESTSKSIVDISLLDEVAHVPKLKIRAITIPSLTPFVGLRPVTRAHAFMELGPATLAGLQGGQKRSFARLAHFINSCHLYTFGVMGSSSDVFRALEEELES